MIGVSVRELTSLKLLHPVMRQFMKKREKFILYHMDIGRGSKEYNRATLKALKASSEKVLRGATKVKSFTSNAQLVKQLKHDGVNKLVSIEIGLTMNRELKDLMKAKVKLYSLHNFTDSMWRKEKNIITGMDRVYYTSKYIMEKHHKFAEVAFNSKRDRVASPLYDYIENVRGDKVLVMLPNIRASQVGPAFGSTGNFVNAISKLAESNKLIFKTRKKQWLPPQIKKFASEIIYDGKTMTPTALSKIIKETHTTVLFYSSGIYESAYAGNYTVNIKMPPKRVWFWPKKMMFEYLAQDPGSLYNYSGVVESINIKDVTGGNWRLSNKLDNEARKKWIDTYIGKLPGHNTKFIVNDIINS